jgi:histidinol phosphatase-like enzyme (inositol monophosphatase family)
MTQPLTRERLAELDAFLIELNEASARAILPLFRADHGLKDKNAGGAFDPVTAADTGAEAAVRQLIESRYPGHGVIGEEFGEDRSNAEFVWVIDPIDGTRSFVAGLPVWTTLLALRFQGEPVLGSIGQPFLGELFIGSQANGSRLVRAGETRPLRVRQCSRLTDAVVATTDPWACFDGAELAAWTQVRAAARLGRFACDAYAYAMVALGTVDLVVEAGLRSWDVEAAVPVIEGAGGFVTDWRGARMGRQGGQMAIAGDRRCLDEALVALSRAAA